MTNLRLHPSEYGNQNLLIEKLIAEAIDIHSVRMYYIPRKLIAEDKILGEDQLSQFKNAYPINCYLENEQGFEGQGAFASKFGLTMEQSATIKMARRRWNQAVGRYGETILPNRPAEGDLLYFPMTRGLFEIMFVNHQNPFYQLGQIYVYELTIELFRYASEVIETGVEDIDQFEIDHTHDTTKRVDIDSIGSSNNQFKEEAADLIFDKNNPFGDIL